jgi:porphobilinogen synthase
MNFPATRLRRLRRTEAIRSLVRETHLHPGALIYPLFICPGEGIRKEISSMPGVFNLSIDEAMKEAEACASLGLGGLLLFGLPSEKDEEATGAWAEDGIVQQALRSMKKNGALDSLVTIADVCLCEYTSHGHCGVVARDGDHYEIQNDSSVALIAKTAASLARAGADIVAPSDMMDGRVEAIRDALDAGGREQIPVMSYASKFASAFYGPFREAADSAPQFGDRRSYQMDGANLREAMREIDQDIAEGQICC